MVWRYAKEQKSMNPQMPYRAMILGEEHIVKGWRGRRLVTNKGGFYVRHIYGNNWPIENVRLLEVATIQSDGQNSWLLNGYTLTDLENQPNKLRASSAAAWWKSAIPSGTSPIWSAIRAECRSLFVAATEFPGWIAGKKRQPCFRPEIPPASHRR